MEKGRLCLRLLWQMIKQIASETMLLLLVIAPILAGLAFKLGIPLLETKLLSRLGYGEVLMPYYGYFNWLVALLTGMLFAFVGALVILGEIDDGVTKYISVTSAGANGYLVARIFLPAIGSGIFAGIVIPVFSLIRIELVALTLMIVSTVLSGIVTSLLVVAISSNKVEGMAIGKLSGGFGMILFVPLVLKGPVQYVFSLFPMFWIGQYLQRKNWLALPLAFLLFLGWIYFLMRRFRRKI